ncbi:benzoate 4-monooxygenase cytochrome P450 [Xylaria palmicola]|nr:benzoate 4-monooxygenase cytochrome P450 [Xylaria palmicola]
MSYLDFPGLASSAWPKTLLVVVLVLVIARIIYNLFFHPLAHVPGPFWAQASGIPSWYYAYTGKRHIWLLKQFETYGYRIRPEPNTVIFRDPEAHADIYSMKSNVRRSQFYPALNNKNEHTTLDTVDVAEHARKRKILNLCFTEKALNAACGFIREHVDRWNQIMADEIDGEDWSAPVDFGDKIDELAFDVMGELCFGRSFNVKEPGENPLKGVSKCTTDYLLFFYPFCRSPFLSLLNWLKPRGLNRLFELVSPQAIKQYNQFVYDSVTKRIALQKEQAEKEETERRQDLFYFLGEARDPDTNQPAYREDELRSESHLLIIAGSDTTSVTLAGIFFYLTGDQKRCQKLVDELTASFDSADDIVYGPKLLACTYLKACIDEGMRLTPAGVCELPREVLPGGLVIKGEHYPEGTIVGTATWANSRNQAVYGDADAFRPERWTVDPSDGNSKEDVAQMKRNFYPFSSGAFNCVGKNLAMAEMMITVARTLYRFEMRRAPGSTLGCGRPDLGWACTDEKQFQLLDAYISLREGPEVQYRRRDRRVKS